ncbi:FecR domain-containing protein [Spirosoma sp. BT702]|uniref:FecR domain-containing protein n=1 Tax=Spirosoma profusum TaxID=2771354 RepID=A0A927AWL5_9BACT|nr:FecR domain-containing protein [Spirosoma profusum]MBD2705734.1 FecR domain-containing protein [Spirosoma profusum]
MTHSLSKQNLFAYLAGQANPLERQMVEEWLKNPANTETFHAWLLEWETRSLQFQPDQEAAFAKLSQRLDQTEAPVATDNVSTASPFFPGGWRPYLVAATVLIAFLAISPLRSKILYQTYQTVAGQTQSIQLEDGTHVNLKPNSLLQVPRFGFRQRVREVSLIGEARFSVTHKQDNQRFVVKTSDQFQVEVLGTEFTVYARKQGTNVVLDRGKIRVDYKTDTKKQQLVMKPGEMVMLTKQGNIHLRPLAPVKAIDSEKGHLFQFRNTSLWEACYLIQEHFGLKVEVADDSLAQRSISGNFHARTANELLDLLTATFTLRVDSTGTTPILKDN